MEDKIGKFIFFICICWHFAFSEPTLRFSASVNLTTPQQDSIEGEIFYDWTRGKILLRMDGMLQIYNFNGQLGYADTNNQKFYQMSKYCTPEQCNVIPLNYGMPIFYYENYTEQYYQPTDNIDENGCVQYIAISPSPVPEMWITSSPVPEMWVIPETSIMCRARWNDNWITFSNVVADTIEFSDTEIEHIFENLERLDKCNSVELKISFQCQDPCPSSVLCVKLSNPSESRSACSYSTEDEVMKFTLTCATYQGHVIGWAISISITVFLIVIVMLIGFLLAYTQGKVHTSKPTNTSTSNPLYVPNKNAGKNPKFVETT